MSACHLEIPLGAVFAVLYWTSYVQFAEVLLLSGVRLPVIKLVYTSELPTAGLLNINCSTGAALVTSC